LNARRMNLICYNKHSTLELLLAVNAVQCIGLIRKKTRKRANLYAGFVDFFLKRWYILRLSAFLSSKSDFIL